MQVHLVDGTYELFRHHFGVPSHRDAAGREVGAVRGVVRSIASMLRDGATHVGVATDHVVESFRNDLYAGYKTGEGLEEELAAQFHPLEDALRALGVAVWPMVEFEADDGLAAAAEAAARDERVERVFVCSPDKDLAQCVRGKRVVQLDRRQRLLRDEDGVREKFGVPPRAIPDYLALVGDAADGFPGVPRWGAKSAALVLARYGRLEDIPADAAAWEVKVRGAAALSASLEEGRSDAMLFRTLATLRTDIPLFGDVEEIRWRGAGPAFADTCRALELEALPGQLPAAP
jgi:5'-3' exonuclease